MPGIERYRRLGLCIACGKPPKPGCKKCQACLDAFQRSRKAIRQRRIAQGLCHQCGKPNDRLGKAITCSVCCAKMAAYRLKAKLDCFNAYGGPVCVCCGETHMEFLSIDHIHGGGGKQRKAYAEARAKRVPGRRQKAIDFPSGGGGCSLHVWLKRQGYPPGFRVLCMNCNFSLGHSGYCPHQLKT